MKMSKENNETLVEDVLRINNTGNDRRKNCNYIFPRDRKQTINEAESLVQIAGKSKDGILEPNKLPLEKPQAKRIHRAVGFESVTESVNRWDGIVTQRRKAEQLVFPLENVDCRVMTTEKNYRPSMKTDLEREVYGLLRGAQLIEEKQETEEEITIRKAMSLEEVRKESQRIAGERILKQRLERKAAMLNKSKSRKYHKILRREKLKIKKQDFETLKQTNPEAAIEILNDIEKTRLEERMDLRHKNSKWLRLQRPRAGHDQMVRDLLKENSDMRKELLEKLQMGQKAADEGMEEDDDQGDQGDQGDQDFILKAQENAIKSGKFDAGNVWVSQLAVPRKKEDPDESFLRMQSFWKEKKEQQLGKQEEKKPLKTQRKRTRDQEEEQEEQMEDKIEEQVELNQWEEQKKKKKKKKKVKCAKSNSKEKEEACGTNNVKKGTEEEEREENTEQKGLSGKQAVVTSEMKKIKGKKKVEKKIKLKEIENGEEKVVKKKVEKKIKLKKIENGEEKVVKKKVENKIKLKEIENGEEKVVKKKVEKKIKLRKKENGEEKVVKKKVEKKIKLKEIENGEEKVEKKIKLKKTENGEEKVVKTKASLDEQKVKIRKIKIKKTKEQKIPGKEAIVLVEMKKKIRGKKKVEMKVKLNNKEFEEKKVVKSLDEQKNEKITKRKVKKTIKDEKEKGISTQKVKKTIKDEKEKGISTQKVKLKKNKNIAKELNKSLEGKSIDELFEELESRENRREKRKKKSKATKKFNNELTIKSATLSETVPEESDSKTEQVKPKPKPKPKTVKTAKNVCRKSATLSKTVPKESGSKMEEVKLKPKTVKTAKNVCKKSVAGSETILKESGSKMEQAKPKQKTVKDAKNVCRNSSRTDLIPPKEEVKESTPLNTHAIENRRLGTARPDRSFLKRKIDNESDDEFSDEGFDDVFDNEENMKLFEEEKKAHEEKNKLEDVNTFLAGWGSWGGPGIVLSEKKRKKFRIKAPETLENKYSKIGNVIYNEKNDVHGNLRKMMVNELPFPFTTVKDFEASIRQPISSTFVPETVHKKLTAPPVVSKMGQVINPMSEEILIQEHYKSLDAPKLEKQMDMKLGFIKKYKSKNFRKNMSKVKTLSVFDR